MHEVSLAEGVLNVIEDYQRKEGFASVRRVRLEIGRMAEVEIEALRFCFESVVKGRVADGATLEIIEVPGQGWCETCRCSVPMQVRFDSCPECGHFPLQVSGGTEMRVCELEVEQEAERE